YPVQEYLGLVFAYLGEGEPPAMWSFPELEGEGAIRLTGPGIWPCNYFNRIENSLDHVNGAFVHRRRVNGYGLGEIQPCWATRPSTASRRSAFVPATFGCSISTSPISTTARRGRRPMART